MSALLSVRELSFAYGARHVLRDVAFELPAASAVALLGANGAGKTTLLKLCAGLLQPSQGEILLRDKPLHQYKSRELAKRIALVPQEVKVSFDFHVRHFVEQGRTPHLSSFLGMLQAHDQAAVDRAMDLANVDHLADRNFNELSGGERQRVKIALALAQEPELLLLDEPAQHLDIGRQAEIFSVLHRLNQEGITIVAAVHDLHSAREHFNAGILLLPDLSAVFGTPAEVLTPTAIQEVYGVEKSLVNE